MSTPAAARLCDPRGSRLGTASRAAAAAVEQALWRMMSFYDTPAADLDAAAAHDPAWLLPPVMKAGFLLSSTEPALRGQSQALLAAAEGLLTASTPARERAHYEAVCALQEGRWHQACRIWGQLLTDEPRDALALQWAHLWDFYRGDALNLRQRPARALPEWSQDDRLYPYVLGLYAFGLEECNLYPQAEEAGRRAAGGRAKVPWAVHAVAHVMEMQGRFEDGAAWLRHHQHDWSDGNGFAAHLWWHKALYRLESMDCAGVLRLVDKRLSGDALQTAQHRMDAAALLWRLHLLDIDVAGCFGELLSEWQPDQRDAGYCSFNDVHIVLAFLGAGEIAAAEGWLARCAERVLRPDDGAATNHAVARDVGLPIMRGLLAHARGEHEAAVAQLAGTRSELPRLGGSHAQREIIDMTLMESTARAGPQSLGRALLNERRMAKTLTPLTCAWAERLGVDL
jgi:tetratricopeptide (TPR) repeat protein